MEHRNGICASCEATYTIPASFQHDKARCRECGGTVEIGPIVSDDSNEPTQELEEYVPSGKKRSGPSMMEQLRSRREEAEADEAPEPTPPPAPKSVAKPLAKPVAKRVQKPIATASPKAAGVRKSAAGASKGKARAGRSGAGSKRSGGARGGKRGGTEKKKAPMGMIIGVGGLAVLLGVSAFLFKDDLFGTENKVDAADTTAESTEETQEPAESTIPEVAADIPETSGDNAADKAMEDAEEIAATQKVAATEESTDPKDKYNPAKIDLASLADYGPPDSTSEEDWDEVQTRMIRAMDPDLGKGQTNEWKFLKEYPRRSFPAIVNYLIHIDYSTKAGTERGKWATRIIEDITHGSNYGWAEFEENIDKVGPGYFEWFNKTVAMKWHQNWGNAEHDLDTWGRMLKMSAAEVKSLKSKLGGSGASDEDEPSSLDLLNED